MTESVDLERRIFEILETALTLEPSERGGYLRRVCEDDALRHAVEMRLTAAEDDALAAPLIDRSDYLTEFKELAIGSQIGRYRIERELGQGGMGAVYLARRADDAYEQRVAIKVLKRGMDTAHIIRRFHNERQILANLSHPNIASLYDGGSTADGRPYFVMEFLPGEPIHHYCDRRGLHIKARLLLFQKVCAAVHFAHQNLVIHRDLKPGNVLVTPQGQPKLLDFGIAKLLSREEPSTMTDAALRMMTPEYASPEQIRGENITTASDVYSLGVLLYELLTGRRPTRPAGGESAHRDEPDLDREPIKPSQAVYRKNKTTAVGDAAAVPETVRGGSPRKLRQTLVGDLDNIVLKALRPAPGQRYASAEQFSEDIQRYLEGYPIRARQESFSQRVVKFVRRNKLLALLMAALALAPLSFYIAKTIEQRQTDRALERAERVSAFLVDVFKISDPYRKVEITARELLDNASREITGALANAPGDRAALLLAMGKVFMNLGLHERARPMLEEALLLRRRYFGQDRLAVAEALHELGALSYEQSDYPTAATLFRQAAVFREDSSKSPASDLADSLFGLGKARFQQGEYGEAEALYQRALALMQGQSGKGLILDYLGHLYSFQGKYVKAETFLTRALEEQRQDHGAASPETATSLNRLGALYRELARLDEAETAFERSLTIRTAVFGDEHPETADSLNNLALLYKDRKQFDRAIDCYLRVLKTYEKYLGIDHIHVAITLNNLAQAYRSMDRPQHAEPLLRRALAIGERVYGPEHHTVGVFSEILAWSLLEQHKYREAAPLAERAHAIYERVLGAEHLNVAKSLMCMARCMLGLDDLPRADAFYQRALEIVAVSVGEQHPLFAEIGLAREDLAKKKRLAIEAALLNEQADSLRAKNQPR